MNECSIVQDLLPLYAEELTSGETREFVESHCADCLRCETLRSRAMQPVETAPIDAAAYQKSLRRDSMKMSLRAVGICMLICVLFSALVGGGTAYGFWESGHWPLENSYESTVVHEEYGTITHKVNISDWDHAGFFNTGAGSVIITEYSIRYSTERADVQTGGTSVSFRDWENMQLYWAPNGMDYLAEVDIVGSERGYFVIDNEYSMNEHGHTSHSMKWYPATNGAGLTEILESLCKTASNFPTGWESIDFTFYAWNDDSETIVFVYETDAGHRGLIDYHFPTETILAVT